MPEAHSALPGNPGAPIRCRFSRVLLVIGVAAHRAVITITADHPFWGDACVLRRAAPVRQRRWCRRCRPAAGISVPCGRREEAAMSALWWILFAVIWIVIAFWPARVAGRKGHSFIGYFIFSLFFFPAAIIVAYLVQDRTEVPGRATTAVS